MELLFALPSAHPCCSSRRLGGALRTALSGEGPHPGVDLRLVLCTSMNPLAVQGVHAVRGQWTCQRVPPVCCVCTSCFCTYRDRARWTWAFVRCSFGTCFSTRTGIQNVSRCTSPYASHFLPSDSSGNITLVGVATRPLQCLPFNVFLLDATLVPTH
jgi:hypothetical protein